MTSRWTFGALGSNPLASQYGQQAATNAKTTGSKYFIYTRPWDDRIVFPKHTYRGGDQPWKDNFTWERYRWIFHDFRMFGFKGFFRKHYYMGESWRRKDERIFVGKDENGNKYWMSRRNTGSMHHRTVESPDPHWFRGQDYNASPPMWQKWMHCGSAHTPAQVKARGEWGLNSRSGMPLPFNIQHTNYAIPHAGANFGREPSFIPSQQFHLNPERKLHEETGYTRWTFNRGNPTNMPFCGVHDYSDEVLEEYYRGSWAFGRMNKGNDHDEWKA